MSGGEGNGTYGCRTSLKEEGGLVEPVLGVFEVDHFCAARRDFDGVLSHV